MYADPRIQRKPGMHISGRITTPASAVGTLLRWTGYKRYLVQPPRSTLNQPPSAHPLMPTDRTALRLSDERKTLLDEAGEIVASDPSGDPPMSDAIDAALAHLVESHENLEDIRDKYPPQPIEDRCNPSILSLRYRTAVESKWRR